MKRSLNWMMSLSANSSIYPSKAFYPTMVNLISKTTLLTFIVVCFSTLLSSAQVGSDYKKFDAGVSLGFNRFYGDVLSSKGTQEVSLNFNYNQTPFLNFILEGQFGKLAGGSVNDAWGRQFASNYQYYALRVQLQAGEIIDYSESQFANAMKNLYIGAGIGAISDKITSINRYSTKLGGFYTPGEDKSNQMFVPVRIGYEFKIFNQFMQPNIKIDVGYQYNYIFGDEIDGYKSGYSNDSFSQFTIGAKFSFGVLSSYRKQVKIFR